MGFIQLFRTTYVSEKVHMQKVHMQKIGSLVH